MERQFGYDFSNVRVHTDEAAGRASRGIGAAAYTAGTDIAFDTGRYAPHAPAGRALLAHELTHVAQQSHASPARAPEIAPAGSAAEHEADHVAAVVAGGGELAGPVSAAGGGIQRSTAGLVGGVVGGVLGGALAIVGLGLLAEFAKARGLTDVEKNEARKVFGGSLNYDQVRVGAGPLWTVGSGGRTPGNTIYLPSDKFKTLNEQQVAPPPGGFADIMSLLIHEMTHAWQTQHGVSLGTKLGTALKGASAYDYGGEAGLRTDRAAGKHFVDYNTEQQASICEDYYLALEGGGDKSAYEPFIAEVKNGGAPTGPGPGATPPAPGPTPPGAAPGPTPPGPTP
jgi:hypothetical protein